LAPPGPKRSGPPGAPDLRAACRVALDTARRGEADRPRVPAPTALARIMRFGRLPATAYATIAKVVDEDREFRSRVAEAVGDDEAAVGRAGWLWLHRPDSWRDDPVWNGGAPVPAAGEAADAEVGAGSAARGEEPPAAAGSRGRAKEPEARRRREAAEAEARRRAKEQLKQLRQELVAANRDLAALQERATALTEERNQAVRRTKQLEAELSEARRDRRTARAATREAEAELAALRSGGTGSVVPAGPGGAESTAASDADRATAAEAVRAAAGAAAELSKHLDAAGALLDPAPIRRQPPRRPRAKERPARATARTRPLATLPPGVFDGSPDAHRHVISNGEALLLVDGYNVARSAWSGITPEEERRRMVRLLEEVRARSGGTVHVVFDGDSHQRGPQASRSVRVHFSPTGVTADDEIARLLGELPRSRPVVVVSSDRAVVADARRQGATSMSSREFLAAARR
jgi:predicted RNA-binding protein with PIN domain